jgi:hypothetical protein
MPGTDVPYEDQKVDLDSQAKQDAEKLLRVKNQKEYRSSLTFVGMLSWPNGRAVESGTNVMFVNKGMFSRLDLAPAPEPEPDKFYPTIASDQGGTTQPTAEIPPIQGLLPPATLTEGAGQGPIAPIVGGTPETIVAEVPRAELVRKGGSGTGAKWNIESVRHEVSGGKFVTNIELRKCLIGY